MENHQDKREKKMSERNKKISALILSCKKQGENNRLATYITRDGIFQSVLYGGPKSKLKSLVQQFNSGTLFTYSDESKHTSKITDFDVKGYHLGIRNDIYKIYAANLACEIVMKTKCAGDSENAFVLLNAMLDGIDRSSEKESRLGLLRFLWRYTGLLGVQPDVTHCAECKEFLLSSSGGGFYSERHSGIICQECMSENDAEKSSGLFLDIHALTYLAAINELKPSKVRELIVPAESAYVMKSFLFSLMEKCVDTRLESLEGGRGIL